METPQLLAPASTVRARRVHATRAGGRRTSTVLLLAVAATVVALQIAWPLTQATANTRIAVLIVVGSAVLCLLHVTLGRGLARAGLVLACTALPGFLVEVIGVHFSVPFGAYSYSTVLGPRLFGVPPLVGLAWTMLCWPAACVARQLTDSPVGRVLLGAWATTAGDLFLDPQLVSLGAWRWRHPSPHLPGMTHVPLTNFAGWLLVTVVLSALIQAVAGPPRRLSDILGVGVYVWSWAAWTVALLFFLHQPAAAGWGFAAMGSVVLPLLARTRSAGVRR